MGQGRGSSLRSVLIGLLEKRDFSSQAEVVEALRAKGHPVTQSTISRLLGQVGAVKTRLPTGEVVYRRHKGAVLAQTPADQHMRPQIIRHFVERVIANDHVFVILTKPDAGRYVAQYIDEAALPDLAGTIAGGNTVLALPMSHKAYARAHASLKVLLGVA